MLRFTIALCVLALGWAKDCQLSNIKVKENFDKYRVSTFFYHNFLSIRTCIFLKEIFVMSLLFCGHNLLCVLQFQGTWYAVAKKDPSGLFLLDNVVATYSVSEEGKMTATAYGRVVILKLVKNFFSKF